MAYDKAVDSAKLDAAMTATADKIRAGTGDTAKIPWNETNGFADSIPEAVAQATPEISVSSGGLITASATQTGGFVASGTKKATSQLTVQAAKTVTPGTSDQTAVASGRYTTGAVKVKGEANLKAANIAKGVSMFGVIGTLVSGSPIATGTFELTGTKNLYEGLSITVNGIPFKPTRVLWFYTGLNNANGGWAGNYIYSFDSADGAYGVIDDGYEDEDTGEWEDYYCWWHHDVYNTETQSSPYEELLYTPLSDGFYFGLMHNTVNDEKYDLRLREGLYTYIAIG